MVCKCPILIESRASVIPPAHASSFDDSKQPEACTIRMSRMRVCCVREYERIREKGSDHDTMLQAIALNNV